MRRRAERDAQFAAIKANIKEAASGVLKAAVGVDALTHTALEALAEAYEEPDEEPEALPPA